MEKKMLPVSMKFTLDRGHVSGAFCWASAGEISVQPSVVVTVTGYGLSLLRPSIVGAVHDYGALQFSQVTFYSLPARRRPRAGFCLPSPGGGGGVNAGTHPPRILAYPQTDKCPPPQGGGGGLTPTYPPTHPRTQLRHAIQKTKFFTEWGFSVTPFTFDTNDNAS